MMLMILTIAALLLALLSSICCAQLQRENRDLRVLCDYYESTTDECDVYRRKYERQLQINDRLMERMKRYGY